ncbi:MAG: FG-GAP-like repeat-containing protein, partial [Actinomycetota bacterium]|nr:FG-GAP-like repeat-containing protein [Actinomycetota bacterium]
MRTLLVVAMVATLVAAVPTSSYAAPGDSPRPTWPDTASLTVTNVTDTGATLSWPAALDAGGVTAYNVYAGADNTTLLGTTANLTINLTGLTPGTPYTVHVEAADADGNESEPLTGTNFSAPTTYTTGASSNPYSIKLADFDEDGDMDIAVANETDSEIGILLGNGDGTFGAVQGWSTGADVDGDGPKNFVVADLNGDTDLDIVAANEYSETVAVVLGDGDGTFQGPTTFAGPIGTHGVAVGSFDAGTTLDIVAVGWGADVPPPPLPPTTTNGGLFFPGVGDGTFGASTEFVEGPSSHEVVAADFDDNGDLDLAIADLEDARVLAGSGAGTFGSNQGCWSPER